LDIKQLALLLVDDHQIIIDGLRSLMYDQVQISGIFQALNAAEAYAIVAEQVIDIVLLDINLPDQTGFEVCKTLKQTYPNLKIIALTMHAEFSYISKMVRAGADGYILKNTGKEELVTAITIVAEGQQYFSKEVAGSIFESFQTGSKPKKSGIIQKLTRREKEILTLIVDEMTTDEIAAKLFISAATVISHRKSLLLKLNAKNTAGLVKAAIEFKLL
jgi:DNA-binding NarL/FixJ family response regulator